MCKTPWGELWTGSSRGWVRVWQVWQKGALSPKQEDGGQPLRELRRAGNLRPHAAGVTHMCCPAGGQVGAEMPCLQRSHPVSLCLSSRHVGKVAARFYISDLRLSISWQPLTGHFA